ncbi:MAG: RNA 2',3'-cyclic phosphodiesterase [Thermoleophilaceae bacterium]|nr:RNA 2',3'-cyclic phosphodiesterase [Thermoleophilaceae bacterium]
MGGREELRLVPARALHVTLVFLGGVEVPDVGAVADTALDALAGVAAPVLAPTGVRGVPARRTRLLALDLADEDGRAAALASTAAAALAACGLHEPERRPFWAHLTLARVRSGRRLAPGEATPYAPTESFVARRVTLYRSHPSPRGARYEALRGVELG